MKVLSIGGRQIGEKHPPFVIAELGINHEGDVHKALQMVDAAAAAGADCVKIQTHIAPAEMLNTGIKPEGISNDTLWNIIRRCELTPADEVTIKGRCAERGVMFLATPFSREAADRLGELEVDAYKIGSGECNNIPLLHHVAGKGKPMILSTGMNDLASIGRSLEAIQSHGTPVMLMHCTSMYPTPYEKVRLGAIAEMAAAWGLPVGLSDHSIGIYTCLGAVALGACALEKHFTITRSWPGPDQPVSIEPAELAEMVRGARAIFLARGGRKGILPEEKPVIDFAYASVVTIRPVARGEVFSVDNAWVKRPGTGGILAAELERVLGRRAARTVAADTAVSPQDVEGF
ncbi:MAG: N-acetylneuraminate synthase family protein [Deltaproteobacteria bacterium]|nr:N-acetylneuraminate synthase family protein [Deltaproteobacteria bacterium]